MKLERATVGSTTTRPTAMTTRSEASDAIVTTVPSKPNVILPTPEVTQTTIESTQTATPTVPASMPGADPFKAHIEKNGLAPSAGNAASPNAANNNAANNSVTHQAGADPFKAFLEKQKQDSKAAGISPFGK